jgi:hypothetical protein
MLYSQHRDLTCVIGTLPGGTRLASVEASYHLASTWGGRYYVCFEWVSVLDIATYEM